LECSNGKYRKKNQSAQVIPGVLTQRELPRWE
jgi:hypothetical protein